MTDMIHLIVPPIIVVFAVAILVVFLAKNIPSENGGGNFILKKNNKRSKKKRGGENIFSRTKSKDQKDQLKQNEEDDETDNAVSKEVVKKDGNTNGTQPTQGIVSGTNGDQIVSLRKKSMVSDKIENAEGRDPAEVALMKEIEEKPQDSKRYEKLGDYYMEHEQFEDARECYKYVLRLDPRHKRAQVAMKNLDRVLE